MALVSDWNRRGKEEATGLELHCQGERGSGFNRLFDDSL
jgi:hypothetical protein